MSVAGPTCESWACSGDMYCGVPSTAPVLVMVVRPCSMREMPKSAR